MPAEKRTVWVCLVCQDDAGYWDEPGYCPMQHDSLYPYKLRKRHRWICLRCGESYVGNRRPPERCECGEVLR